jgi:ferrous iron transport protein B
VIIRAGEPLVTGVLGLPKEASAAFLIGFLRRDFAATRLFDMSQRRRSTRCRSSGDGDDHALHPHRERLHDREGRGWKTAAAMAAFIFPLAFATGGLDPRFHAGDRDRVGP